MFRCLSISIKYSARSEKEKPDEFVGELKNMDFQFSKYEDILNLRFLAQYMKNWQETFNLHDAG